MFKVTVLYNHPDDPEAFEKYYTETHTPIAMKIPYASNAELTKFVETQQGKPTFYRMAEFNFVNAEDMQAALKSPEGLAAVNDLPNFATGGVQVMIGTFEKLPVKQGQHHK